MVKIAKTINIGVGAGAAWRQLPHQHFGILEHAHYLNIVEHSHQPKSFDCHVWQGAIGKFNASRGPATLS